jgi:hypothetical protein
MRSTEAYLLFLMIHDRMRKMRNEYNILAGEPAGQWLLRTLNPRWENNFANFLNRVLIALYRSSLLCGVF